MAKKIYYKIGEACRAVDIQPYVLRYWETEFPVLVPEKSRSGQRVYTEEEIGTIRRIKELLYEEGYTIAGAKKKLEGGVESGAVGSEGSDSPEDGEVAEPEPDSVDTRLVDRVETLERGVEQALEEVRDLLRKVGGSE